MLPLWLSMGSALDLVAALEPGDVALAGTLAVLQHMQAQHMTTKGVQVPPETLDCLLWVALYALCTASCRLCFESMHCYGGSVRQTVGHHCGRDTVVGPMQAPCT